MLLVYQTRSLFLCSRCQICFCVNGTECREDSDGEENCRSHFNMSTRQKQEEDDEEGGTPRAGNENRDEQRSSVWEREEAWSTGNPWALFLCCFSRRKKLFVFCLLSCWKHLKLTGVCFFSNIFLESYPKKSHWSWLTLFIAYTSQKNLRYNETREVPINNNTSWLNSTSDTHCCCAVSLLRTAQMRPKLNLLAYMQNPLWNLAASALPSECLCWNWELSDLSKVFQSVIIQFWCACMSCNLSFLNLAKKSGTQCRLLLQRYNLSSLVFWRPSLQQVIIWATDAFLS